MSTMLSIKVLSLSALCILLTVMAIVMHVSRTQRDPGIPPYKPASAVLLAELGKLTVSLLLAWKEVKDLLVSEREQDGEGSKQPGPKGKEINSKFNEGVEEADLDEQAIPRQRQTSAQMHATESQIPLLSSTSTEAAVSTMDILQRMKKETFGHGWQHMSVPALLFTGQSNLAYYASSNLSVPIFQITYQLKIPATALCSVLMLGRSLSRIQWFSIVLLSLGVGIVQLATQAVEHASHPPLPTIPSGSIGLNSTFIDPLLEVRSHQVEHVKPEMNQFLGLAAVCLACLSSGFASVFFEKQLKRPTVGPLDPHVKEPRTPAMPSSSLSPPRKTGLWIRNIQLSLFSLSVGLAIYICTSSGSYKNFLQGFTPLVWFLVALQVSGGLLAALVIQYADNIAKSFSASCSIILSFGASMLLFDYQLTQGVLVGSVAVIGATWLFNVSGAKPTIATTAEAKPFVSQLKSPKAEYAPLHVPSRKPSLQSLAGNPFLPDAKSQIPSRPPSRLAPH